MGSIVFIALLLLAGAIAKKSADSLAGKAPEPQGSGTSTDEDHALPGLGGVTEEDLAFPSKDAVIAATLKRPNVSRQCPAVVLVAGGGPNKRNDSRILNAIADQLAENGIASLRYDKRGLGQSTGDRATCTSGDLADDAHAAIEFLKDRVDIDPNKLGLIGHSEGGTIVQRVAATCDDVSFVIALAAPELPGAKFFESQMASLLKAQGVEQEEITRQVEVLQQEHAILSAEPDDKLAAEKLRALHGDTSEALELRISYLVSPWRRFANSYDPITDLRNIKCPILAIFAGNDQQVTVEENPTIAADQLVSSRDATVLAIDGLNHAFQSSRDGMASDSEPVSPVVLELVKLWVLEQV
jgi:pimeloyl-ACP methyl ester carboxylesterase